MRSPLLFWFDSPLEREKCLAAIRSAVEELKALRAVSRGTPATGASRQRSVKKTGRLVAFTEGGLETNGGAVDYLCIQETLKSVPSTGAVATGGSDASFSRPVNPRFAGVVAKAEGQRRSESESWFAVLRNSRNPQPSSLAHSNSGGASRIVRLAQGIREMLCISGKAKAAAQGCGGKWHEALSPSRLLAEFETEAESDEEVRPDSRPPHIASVVGDDCAKELLLTFF